MASTMFRVVVTLLLVKSLTALGTSVDGDKGDLEKPVEEIARKVRQDDWKDMDDYTWFDKLVSGGLAKEWEDSDSSNTYCCETNDDCDDRDFRICVNRTCVCHPSFVEINNTCAPLSCIGEPCSETIQCKGEHVFCGHGHVMCLCKPGFILTQKGKCVNCTEVDGNATEACLCNGCGEECSVCHDCLADGDCTLPGQVCVYNVCLCNSTTYPDDCGLCVPKKPLGDECTRAEECLSNTCICDVCVSPDTSDCCDA